MAAGRSIQIETKIYNQREFAKFTWDVNNFFSPENVVGHHDVSNNPIIQQQANANLKYKKKSGTLNFSQGRVKIQFELEQDSSRYRDPVINVYCMFLDSCVKDLHIVMKEPHANNPGSHITHDSLKCHMYMQQAALGQERVQIAFDVTITLADHPNPIPSLQNDLKVALNDLNAVSDIRLVCRREVINCHKVILMARSSVLRERIQRGDNEVQINELSPDIVQKMIHYLYFDDLGESHATDLEKLLKAADKFGIDSLKELCQARMLLMLNKENSVNMLRIAKMYEVTKLQEKAKELVAGNIRTLMRTRDFATLMNHYPDVFMDS